MKYNVNDYFRKYLMYLSKKNELNLQEKDISSYCKALNGCDLVEESLSFDANSKGIFLNITLINTNADPSAYIDTSDNSLNCRINLNDAIYRIKLVNDKLYYSIYFVSEEDREDLNGIYFYESDEAGNIVYKFYDGNVIKTLSNWKFRHADVLYADDSMLQNHGFSPDYEEKQEFHGFDKFDAARAFNDLLLTLSYYKAIAFMTSINKKLNEENDEYNLTLSK